MCAEEISLVRGGLSLTCLSAHGKGAFGTSLPCVYQRQEAAKEALEGEHTERKMTYISELGAFSDVDEFFLMAACRHQIISNSSYSTWAAYLNPNPEKVVIMPEYKGCEQIRLKEWIVL